MIGLRSGTLEAIPPHPGRTAPHDLLRRWLEDDNYEPIERLGMTLDAVPLGVADARRCLRPAFDAAMAAGAGEQANNAALAARALETLHADNGSIHLDELERLAT